MYDAIIINLIDDNPGITVLEVSNNLNISSSQVYAICVRLVEQGIVLYKDWFTGKIESVNQMKKSSFYAEELIEQNV